MTRRRFLILGIVLLIVLGGGGFLFLSSRQNVAPVTASVERKTVVQEVDVTGTVEAKESSTLGFDSGGIVSNIFVRVGDHVVTGQQLVAVDTRSLALDVAKARADRASAQEKTRLAVLEARATANDTQLKNTETLRRLTQTVRDTKAQLDQSKAIYEQKVREIGDESSTSGSTLLSVQTAEAAYHAAQRALTEGQKTVDAANNAAQLGVTSTEAAYMGTLRAAQNTTGLSSVSALEQSAALRLQKGILRAPFTGTITSLDVHPGEYVSFGQKVATLETTSELQLAADVPETDATKLREGLSASVNFDALPDTETQIAHLDTIYPSAKLIEGVPTYHILLTPETTDSLRAGMTANITIHAHEKKDVLAIPRRAVHSSDSTSYVTILSSDGKEEKRTITTGLVGSDGSIEVPEGLSEGERVVLPSPTR